MKIMEILEKYLNFLWEMFMYDMDVFSKGWIYAWVLIPAIGYFIFFWIKWIVLTIPVWMPLRMILSGVGGIIKSTVNKIKKVKQ